MKKIVCAFTGHRPKKFPWKYNESDADCVALKEVLFDQIRRLVDRGVTEFLSGMAEGIDYEKRKVMRSKVLYATQKNSRQRNHFA